MLDAGPQLAVLGVVLLLARQEGSSGAFAVRDDEPGIPLPVVTADDAALPAHVTAPASEAGEGSFLGRKPLIVDDLLMGHPDDGPDDDYLLYQDQDQDRGWLIIAVRADDGQNQFVLLPITHLERPSPAARILRNYAAPRPQP
ncbi:hypothetical protein [Streptomyces sp. NPDC093111]|uniref:hypothetical protein n=1 Tax=Streptomyces sp. NPDC093111 TaxID=3154978 RepID=UPI00341C36A3